MDGKRPIWKGGWPCIRCLTNIWKEVILYTKEGHRRTSASASRFVFRKQPLKLTVRQGCFLDSWWSEIFSINSTISHTVCKSTRNNSISTTSLENNQARRITFTPPRETWSKNSHRSTVPDYHVDMGFTICAVGRTGHFFILYKIYKS